MMNANLIKNLLYIFNCLFAISGLGLIVAGSLIIQDVNEFRHFMESRLLGPPIVLIIVGCIVLFVAMLGCYGTLKESYLLLIIFAVFLLIIFIIELAVGIAGCVYQSELHENVKQIMQESLKNEFDQAAWDNLHQKLKCCGVDGPVDWKNKRPSSCCHPPRDGAAQPSQLVCQNAQTNEDILYLDGCFEIIQNQAKQSANVLIGVGIGICFIEIIGIVLAYLMARAIKNESKH